MPNFRAATAFLLLLSNLAAAQPGNGENCEPIEELGTPDLDRFDYSVEMVSTSFCVFFCVTLRCLKSDIISTCPTHVLLRLSIIKGCR